MTEEKVCLTKVQMENIKEAIVKEALQEKGGCPKARSWVRGYWPNLKKPHKEQTVEGWINTKISSKINSKLNEFLEHLF